ncbi:hypothetical protein HDC90_005186 [Pedobacter sp. AK013]|uniref:hypothetical protein n=1 Tax=Pedobacter sp. AK013 TaxID=2723071 RepID=UPI00161E2A0C|nr:hypothetical protein [Pedobacter sp. AK013]MBB6240508.1 hypothetical protein [Pedobacter sp. AK013]
MRHLFHILFTMLIFTMLIIGCVHGAYAAKTGNRSTSLRIIEQDTLSATSRQVKQRVEKDKKESLAQTRGDLQHVPKAKNKIIPKTIGPASINVKSLNIKQVKVKVNTQVKIKL